MIDQYHGVSITEEAVAGSVYTGVSIAIPETERVIQVIRCRRGLLCCGIVSQEAVEAIGAAVCLFRAPALKDLLYEKPFYISSKARELGASENLTGQEIVTLFS